jgi:hypothetical protein
MRRLLTFVMVVGCATTATTSAPELAGRRVQMLGWLHEYIVRAEYPTDGDGLPISELIDERGVRCPMAELMHRDGRDDLVAWGARTNNHVRLADVNDGPLADWMASTGLSRVEIDLVQGGLTIDETRRIDRQALGVEVTAARAEVHGRLAATERALHTDATPRTTEASRQTKGTTR